MARYDYQCSDCGAIEEHIHGMTEDPDIYCDCGGIMGKVFLVAPMTAIAPCNQASYGGKTFYSSPKKIDSANDPHKGDL